MKVKDACQINPLSKENWDYINYLDTSSVVNDSLVSPFQLIYGTYPSRAQRIIKKDDILISSVRPNLKHNYFVRDLPDHAMASSGFIQVRVRSKDYLPRFVFYYLTNPSMTAHYSSIAESAQTTFPTFNKKVIEEMPIPDIDIAEQRHIVDAIGSVDDLAENNTKQIAEIRHSISLLLAIEKQSSKYFPLKGHISFIKGKVLKESGEKRLPYLSLDSLNGSQEFSFSYDGIEAKKTDVLLLMDGASSGAVYFGNEGYVGSTFAIIRHDESVDPYVLFAVLREYQDTIKERTTGSAIPHADKHLIEELGYPCLASSNAEKLHSLIDRECNLLRQKRILNKIKETLLNKYF